jgi:hypothetical protein
MVTASKAMAANANDSRDVAVVRMGRARKAWPQALLCPATILTREMNNRRRAVSRGWR